MPPEFFYDTFKKKVSKQTKAAAKLKSCLSHFYAFEMNQKEYANQDAAKLKTLNMT